MCTSIQNCSHRDSHYITQVLKNVDGAMHFIYSHKYNTNSAEDSIDMN